MGLIVCFRSAVSLLGRFPALAGVDLDVAAGEVVLVHGPNGAGKTTLLRACAGLVAISAGEAHVLGHDLTAERRAVRRRVGLLGHGTGLYDDLTVADNLRFSARAAGRPVAAAEAAMARMGLDGRLRDVAVGRLSAGQRRRTALAAVVARQPELWLLDEPHAGLDAPGRDLLDGIIRASAADGGTVVLASHELERARALASRHVAMAGGRVTGGVLASEGSPTTVSRLGGTDPLLAGGAGAPAGKRRLRGRTESQARSEGPGGPPLDKQGAGVVA